MRTPQFEREDRGKLYWLYRIYEIIAISQHGNDPALVGAICGNSLECPSSRASQTVNRHWALLLYILRFLSTATTTLHLSKHFRGKFALLRLRDLTEP